MQQSQLMETITALLATREKTPARAELFHVEQVPWPEGVFDYMGQTWLATPDGVVGVQSGDWIVSATDGCKFFVRLEATQES